MLKLLLIIALIVLVAMYVLPQLRGRSGSRRGIFGRNRRGFFSGSRRGL